MLTMRAGKPVALVVLAITMKALLGDTLLETVSLVATAKAAVRVLVAVVGHKAVLVAVAVWMLSASRGSDAVWALLVAAAAAGVWLV